MCAICLRTPARMASLTPRSAGRRYSRERSPNSYDSYNKRQRRSHSPVNRRPPPKKRSPRCAHIAAPQDPRTVKPTTPLHHRRMAAPVYLCLTKSYLLSCRRVSVLGWCSATAHASSGFGGGGGGVALDAVPAPCEYLAQPGLWPRLTCQVQGRARRNPSHCLNHGPRAVPHP